VEDSSQPLPADEAEPLEAEGTEPEAEEEAEPAESSESAPDSEPEEKKTEFTPEQQEVFNKVIGEKTFKQREAERKLQAAEKELADLRAKLPQEQRPQIPQMPDPYDADYDKKVLERDKAIKEQAAYDARQQTLQEQEANAIRMRQEAQQAELVKRATTYAERAEKMGIDSNDLQNSANALAQYGISDDLTQFILKDDQGPLLTTYLARNPVALEELQGLSPIELGHHIAVSIKPNLAPARTRTQAPDPPDVLDGGGSPPTERGPKGATYE